MVMPSQSLVTRAPKDWCGGSESLFVPLHLHVSPCLYSACALHRFVCFLRTDPMSRDIGKPTGRDLAGGGERYP